MLGEEKQTQLDSSLSTGASSEALHTTLIWDLYVDKSLSNGRNGAGLILSSPELERIRIKYALHLKFKVSNNEAEHEALLADLRITQVVGTKHLSIFSNSQLVVRQVS